MVSLPCSSNGRSKPHLTSLPTNFALPANLSANFKFSSTPLFTIVPSSGNPIVNVAPADYDHDGRLDVLVMTQGSSSSAPIEMEVWMGRGRSGLLGECPGL